MTRWAPCAFFAVAMLACSGDDGAPDLTDASYALTIGTGEASFEALGQDERVQMIAGTQGGFHVWISLRAQGFASDRLRMQLTLTPGGGAPVAASDLDVSFAPAQDAALAATGVREHVGWPGQLLMPWCAVEHALTVEATVRDVAGHSARAAIEIVPTAPTHGFPQTCDAT